MKKTNKYLQKQIAFFNIRFGWGSCPVCGNNEIYFENPRTGNGLYNCDYCGYSAHERRFKILKIRKVTLKRWIYRNK